MIESIRIAATATYGPAEQVVGGLRTFNYFFGANGSGKTTISRVIADAASPARARCGVAWLRGTPLDTVVYNRDFVAANFGELPIKGVFTLGKQSIDDAEALRLAGEERASKIAEIERLKLALEGDEASTGKRAELKSLEQALDEKCWAQKIKHQDRLSDAFVGYKADKVKFKQKVLDENTRKRGDTLLLPLADMQAKALTVYGEAPSTEPLISSPSADALIRHEANQVLSKVVVGSADVDIAALIEKLGNSDWVKQGRPFLANSEGACPFCQQPAPVSLEASLEAFFSGAFAADSEAIDMLATAYTSAGQTYVGAVDAVLAADSARLDNVALRTMRDLAAAKIAANSALIEAKKREPSRVVVLDTLATSANEIAAMVAAANDAVRSHNSVVANLKSEREALTTQVWRHLVERELTADLAEHANKKNGVEKAIQNMERLIAAAELVRDRKAAEIRVLEKNSTSVQPTVNDINALLQSYGFRSFSLARVGESNTYRLRRADDSDARETLSEGEKSFVTFLYFHFLLRGSPSDSGTVNPRVAVFDDPVSSLDSDALFIVSSLIHGLMEQVREGTSAVKQVFILTHNVHFHKEVTFDSRRSAGGDARADESFWVVRKPAGESRVEAHSCNPVSSSYEMLWAEIRRKDLTFGSVQNTMRRILESYFKILGGIDPKTLDKHFDGQDKIICKSLFSWINAGSHGFFDDFHYSVGPDAVATHLRVFKEIFTHSKHESHYQMMMREPMAAIDSAAPPTNLG